ncbi:hypothetical protein LJB42_003548 [Komagataella kurtzmanii]|nr:hypothetical protein LJB42_003548 [Komagataella kurtzmanii]
MTSPPHNPLAKINQWKDSAWSHMSTKLHVNSSSPINDEILDFDDQVTQSPHDTHIDPDNSLCFKDTTTELDVTLDDFDMSVDTSDIVAHALPMESDFDPAGGGDDDGGGGGVAGDEYTSNNEPLHNQDHDHVHPHDHLHQHDHAHHDHHNDNLHSHNVHPFQISQSNSSSTISSFDSSAPTYSDTLPTNSLPSSMSPSNTRTPARRRSLSATPQTASHGIHQQPLVMPQYQTPIKKTDSLTPRRLKSRSLSRLSLDHLRSPAGNPFYTPPAFLSPKLESPYSSRDTPQQEVVMISPSQLSLSLNRKSRSFTAPAGIPKKLRTAPSFSFADLPPQPLPQAHSMYHAQGGSHNSVPKSAPAAFNSMQRSRSSTNLSAIALSKESSLSRRNVTALETPFQVRQTSQQLQKASTVPNMHSEVNMTVPEQREVFHEEIEDTDKVKEIEEEKKKKFSCPVCHARFQRPEHVKRHMRSHSSEKPFVCPEEGCGTRFNRKDNLKAHLKKIHSLHKNQVNQKVDGKEYE